MKEYHESEASKEHLKRLHANQGVSIEVLDLDTGISTAYSTIKEGAEYIGCRRDKISRYFTRSTQKPYRKKNLVAKNS